MKSAHKDAQRELNMIYSRCLHKLATRPLFIGMPVSHPPSRLQRLRNGCNDVLSRLRDAWRVLTGAAIVADQDDL